MAAYTYGSLTVPVTADTRDLKSVIARDASEAGHQAAGSISQSMTAGLKAVGGLGAAVGKSVATGIAGATVAATAFGVEAFKTAARAGEMDASLRALAKANNISYDAMQQSVSAVRKQGIEAGVAQGLVAQFARNQLDLSKSTDLARVAQDAAVISGKNSTEVLDALVHGITTQNSAVLRNAGLNVQAGQAVAQYAKSLGKTVAELTDAERAQAVLNAVLESGKGVAGAYASAMEEPGKVLRSFPRIVDDIKLSVGQGLVQAFGPMILQAYDLAKALSAALAPGGQLAPIFDAIGVAVGKLVAPLSGMIAKWTEWINNLKPEQVQRVVDLLHRFGPAAIAGAAGLTALVAPGLLGQIPILGGLLTNLLGPVKLVAGGLGSVGQAALHSIPALSSVVPAAGGVGAALGAAALPIAAVVAGFAALMIASSDFREAVFALGRGLLDFLMPILKGLWEGALKPVLMGLWDIVRAIGDALAPVIKELSKLLKPLGELFGEVAGGGAGEGGVSGLGAAINIVVPIIVGLIKVIGFVLEVLVKIIVPIAEVAIKLLSWVQAISNVMNPLKALGGAIEWLIGIVKSLWHWITGNSPGLIPAFGALGQAAMAVAGMLGGAVSGAFSALAGVVQSAHGAMTSAVSGAWSQMKSVTSAGISQMSSAVSSGFSGMVGMARSAGSSMVEGLKSGLSAARGLGGWISSNVTGPVTSMIKGGLGIGSPSTITIYFGEEMVEGLKRGLQTAKQHLGWIRANVCDPIIGALKGAFGIGSPSRVTMGIGEDLAAGLEEGWSHAAGALEIPGFGGGPAIGSPLAGGGLSAAAGGMTGAGGATINVYPQAGQDEREIAALVSRELAWATAGGLG